MFFRGLVVAASLVLVAGCHAGVQKLYVGPTFLTPKGTAAAVETDADGTITRVFRTVPESGPFQRVVLPQGTAVAGLHDAHLHLAGVGRQAEILDLRGSTSIAQVREKIRRYVQKHPHVGAIIGRGWDQTRFPSRAFPHAKDLAGLTRKAIYLTRVDGHAIWVNEVLLKRAGITDKSVSPPGGLILKGDDKQPTGILLDRAIPMAKKALAKPTPQDLKRWLLLGAHAVTRAGLVAIHDMGMSPQAFEQLLWLNDRNQLPRLRIYVYLYGSKEASYQWLTRWRKEPPRPHIHLKGIKLFADGALGSRGAALITDYADKPGHKGLLLTSPQKLARKVKRVHDAGYQVAIHAIGDLGNREALNAIESLGPKGLSRRHRIEHAQVVAADDFKRFKALGIIASMQPTHATSDMRWAHARLGDQRIKGAYAWQRFLRLKVPLAFGSDAPVESHRPMWGLWSAITRQDHKGNPKGGWRAEDKMTSRAALRAFSYGAAFAVHQERTLGRIAPGYRLDLTVVGAKVNAKPQTWRDAPIRSTVVDGRVQNYPPSAKTRH